jgi:hypothetical protein
MEIVNQLRVFPIKSELLNLAALLLLLVQHLTDCSAMTFMKKNLLIIISRLFVASCCFLIREKQPIHRLLVVTIYYDHGFLLFLCTDRRIKVS